MVQISKAVNPEWALRVKKKKLISFVCGNLRRWGRLGPLGTIMSKLEREMTNSNISQQTLGKRLMFIISFKLQLIHTLS